MSEEAETPELSEVRELSSQESGAKEGKRRRLREHDDRMRARVLEEFAKSGSVSLACKAAGCARGCHYKWLENYPEYREEFQKLSGQVADLLEDEALRRALHGVDKPVFQGGKQVGKIREYSDFLMALLLKGRKRETYGDRQEISGPNGGPITISPLGEVLRARRHKRGDES